MLNTDRQGGHLKVNGKLVSSSVILTGGVLSGNGVIEGDLIASGLVSPGNSPGLLTINGDFHLQAGGDLLLEVTGRDPGMFDQLDVAGMLSFDQHSRITISFIEGFAPKAGDFFDFFTTDSISGFSTSIVALEGLEDSFQYQLGLFGDNYGLFALNDGVSTRNVVENVPAASTSLLLAYALLLLIYLNYKRRAIVRRNR